MQGLENLPVTNYSQKWILDPNSDLGWAQLERLFPKNLRYKQFYPQHLRLVLLKKKLIRQIVGLLKSFLDYLNQVMKPLKVLKVLKALQALIISLVLFRRKMLQVVGLDM